MKIQPVALAFAVLLSFPPSRVAGTLYVDLNCTNPVPPYATWATAATNIQDAVDAATAGDLVLVTDGVYQTGGRLVLDSTTNRLAITKPLTVKSVHGAGATVIRGYQVPGTTNGVGAIRCAYLTNGAALIGFTLTGGATQQDSDQGGGANCDWTSTLSDCVVVDNDSVSWAGGVYRGSLSNCVISRNRTGSGGGGTMIATLNRCLVLSNYCNYYGGGIGGGWVNNCLVMGNRAASTGGGSDYADLVNCTVVSNYAQADAGGAYGGRLYNSIIYYNTSTTPVGKNCDNANLFSCCATNYNFVAPTDDIITTAPQFIDPAHGDYRLQPDSACVNRGNNVYVTNTMDLDGNLRVIAGTADIGAYECQNPAWSVFRLWLYWNGLSTNGSADYADPDGDHMNNWQEWQSGTSPTYDGSVLKLLSLAPSTNSPGLIITWQSVSGMIYYIQRSYAMEGHRFYTIASNILAPTNSTSYTDTSAIGSGPYFYRIGTGPAPLPDTHYVDVNSANPLPPYTNWNTAATNIQDAVDAASDGDTVLVTNGVYQSGGQLTWYQPNGGTGFWYGSRVTVAKALMVRSVNGSAVTTIQGSWPRIRCVSLANGAHLSGFTLAGGTANTPTNGYQAGGGVYCASDNEVVSDCSIIGNQAYWGGGAYGGVLHDCTLISNSTSWSQAPGSGGAACSNSLIRCRITGNAAWFGGATYQCALYDCVVSSNSAVSMGGGAYGGSLSNCIVIGNWATNSGGGSASNTLVDCTLIGNSARSGGGVYYSVLQGCGVFTNTASLGGGSRFGTLTNCAVVANHANSGAGIMGGTASQCLISSNYSTALGGGADLATLYNCMVIGNTAEQEGGGIFAGTMVNCLVAGNQAETGGGVSYTDGNGSTIAGNSATLGMGGANWGWLSNCIVFHNDAPTNANYDPDHLGEFHHCCTTPLPGNGSGNITNEPAFVDLAGRNFRLQPNSPCINAGKNAWVSAPSDLDGNPRISGGTVDIGAYEFQNPASRISYAWLQQYGWPTDGSADYVDPDSDRLNNWQEWTAQTDPTDATSLLKVLSLAPSTDPPGFTITWQSQSGVSYYVQRSRNLGAQPTFLTIMTDIQGQPGTTSYTDTTATDGGACFYRVGAGQPQLPLTRYVNVNSPAPAWPYTTWNTAAVTIQDAVDAASDGDVVVVTNGLYETGGRVVYGALTNRVGVTKAITIESVNGPAVTIIQGYRVPVVTNGDSAVRCVYLTNGAVLTGFTLTNGATRAAGDQARERRGAGVFCESAECILNNCVLAGNAAHSLGASGGGAYGGTLNYCSVFGNESSGTGGTSGSRLNHCLVYGNRGILGGGCGGGVLNNCTITNNSGFNGGGVGGSNLTNCVVAGNSAAKWGGGLDSCTAQDCVISGNSARAGGGAYQGRLFNCVLSGNVGTDTNDPVGGGAYGGWLVGCLLTGNSGRSGAGAAYGTLENCTVVSNSASISGGGTYRSTLYNTIVYYNSAPVDPDCFLGTVWHCCVSAIPVQPGPAESITSPPLFLNPVNGNYRLQPTSPCINSGDNSHVSIPVDLDGRLRIAGGTVDMGAYENQTHFVDLTSPNPTPPYLGWSTAATAIQDAVDVASDGDLVLVTNGIYQDGGRAVDGSPTNRVAVTKAITVQSVNGPATTSIRGFHNPDTVNGNDAVRCVYLTNDAVLTGFTLIDGATLINPDVESQNPRLFAGGGLFCQPGAQANNCVITNCAADDQGGGVWCESSSSVVSNCVITGCSTMYGGGVGGGKIVGCVLSHNTSYSGGGAQSSVLIDCLVISNSSGYGGGAAYSSLSRCILSANFAADGYYGSGGGSYECTLNNCTISNNVAHLSGGGAIWGTLVNCVLVGNSAVDGGGTLFGTLSNCVVRGNQAQANGGGALFSTLNNCTVTGNSCDGPGGGDRYGTLNNCIIYYNTAASDANFSGSTLNYCCTTPDPNRTGSFANEPAFVNGADGDLRMQSNSPCINAGNNAFVTTSTDLDGHPRIVGGTVDIGAYEFQNPSSVISYAWLQQYDLPNDGSADYADTDGDLLNNWQEWSAGTDPTNALSLLKMLTLSNDVSGTTVSWQSVSGVNYSVERSDLTGGRGFSTIQSNVIGQADTTSFTDTNANSAPRLFYRVGVQ